MKKTSIVLALVFLLFFPFQVLVEAQPGRRDSSGGQNCSEKSQAKDLRSGYHYHNGGDISSDNSTTSSESSSTRLDNYNIAYTYAKKLAKYTALLIETILQRAITTLLMKL